MEDAVLLRATAKGDVGAFENLIVRYRNLIYHTAYQILGDWADAEDVLQEALLKILYKSSDFHGHGSAKAWILQITINAALNWRRRLKRLILAGRSGHSIDQAIEDSHDWMLLDEIRSLPPKHRAVIVLKYVHDLPDERIGEILNCPAGTVKSRVHYALQRLRRKLGSNPGERCVVPWRAESEKS